MKSKLSQIVLCFVVFVVCALMIAGCGNMDKKTSSGITLKATKDVFVTTARSAKKLIDNGVIKGADAYAVKDAYEDGREMLIQAKALWDNMVALDSYMNMREYENALIEVSRMAATIEDIIREYDSKKNE